MGEGAKTDLSSFLCIVLMLTGVMVTLLISNVMIVAANPDNVVISAAIVSHAPGDDGEKEEMDLKGTLFPRGNKDKEAQYIEVQRDHIILYPGRTVVSVRDLESPDNDFEKYLRELQEVNDTKYLVMLVRPKSWSLARRLRKVVQEYGVDLGFELFEAGRAVRI